MRLQSSQANCGPFALRNALMALGLQRSEKECEALCRVTAADGTSAANLWRAVQKVDDLRPRKIDEGRFDVAMLQLHAALDCGHPVILLVDNWEHWVAAIGTLGTSRVLVADSADAELVLSYDWGQLMKRWECNGAKRPYWAVSLG